MARFFILVAAIICVTLGAGTTPAHAKQSYVVEFEGAPSGFQAKLELISELKKGTRDYPTSAALRRAGKRDVKTLDAALQSGGYYASKTTFELRPGLEGGNPTVIFHFQPGPAFKITEYEILYRDEEDARPVTLAEMKITPSGSAAGAVLRDLQFQFLNHLWESGYPAAEIESRRAIANIEKGTAHAVFVFRSGPKARYGDIKIEGAVKTNPSYIRKLKTWTPGEQYERSNILSYRDRLAETSLFSTINISAGAPDEAGLAPIFVNLEERKGRTVGAGASFSTTVGPGGRVFFENRNIFGKGENLRIELRGSKIEQSINFDATKPLPALPGFAFANFEFSNELTDAFDARSISLSSGLAKRWLDDRLETRAGFGLETSNVKTEDTEERTYLLSAPISVLWNSESDLLNPADGFRASAVVTPYTGSLTFTQSEISARSRVNFGKNSRFTVAVRGALGATFGSSLTGLPRNKRFFAGGGGSVRGFGFQEAGPLDANSAPIGGRSLIEAAIEARGKVTDEIQIAAFVDAGSVAASNLPDFGGDFFFGYGVGIRYLTVIGPIRADIGFPFDKRETDSSFQIYIALGQSF